VNTSKTSEAILNELLKDDKLAERLEKIRKSIDKDDFLGVDIF
jgi:hypothetical protein